MGKSKAARISSYEDLLRFFWSHVEKTDTCWNWTGGKNSNGYGQFYAMSLRFSAHRFAYEICVGPIPPGLTIDHLCRNHGCVNPAHIEPVTIKENVRRGFVARRKAKQGDQKSE